MEEIEKLLEFGIINIDKPSGPTSFDVSNYVNNFLGLKKTSHFGTLDPKVTGVLPIALNRGCKLTGFFLGEDKEYVGIMRLHEDISIEELKKAMSEKFLGKINQKPPVKSRVKRVLREREIKSFEILEKDEKDFLFRVECQGGTYIRKLVSDLGEYLGIGAHMLELRRTRAGIFKEDNAIRLYELEKLKEAIKEQNLAEVKKYIIPGEEAIKKIFRVIKINSHRVKELFTGKPLFQFDLVKKEKFELEEKIAVFCEERFIGIYIVENSARRFARPDFVMQPIKQI